MGITDTSARIRVQAVTQEARAALRELLGLFGLLRSASGQPMAPDPAGKSGAEAIGRALRDAAQEARDLAREAGRPIGEPLPGAEGGARDIERAASDAADAILEAHQAASRRTDPLPGAEEGLRRTTGAADGLRNMLIAIVGIDALQSMGSQVITLSDTWTGLTARMQTATGSQQASAATMAAAKKTAADFGAPLAEVGNLYVRLTNAVKPLGGGLKEVTVLAESMAASLKKDGASAEEASSAIQQFSQAMAAGKLGGEEFNSVAEAAPSFLNALAGGLGVARGELKKMAEEGKLTTAAVTQAMAKALPQLQADARAAGNTIGSGFTAVNNALLEFVGKGMQTSGVANALANGLKVLADNVGPVVTGLTALSTIAVAAALGRGAAAAVTLATSAGTLGTALAGVLGVLGGPVGLVVMVGALAAAWIGLSAAKSAATKKSLEDLQAERAAVQAKQDELAANAKRGVVGFNVQAQKNALDADGRRLDAEIEARRREDEARLRASAGPRGGGSTAPEAVGANLRETGALTEFIGKNSGPEQLRRDHNEKMKSMEAIFQKEIAALEREGNTARIAELKRDFAAAKLQATKELNDKLRGFTKDAELSRLATYKESYDGQLALQIDGLKREADENQRAYDAGLKGSRAYFAERARIENEQVDLTVKRLQAELAARQKVLDDNQARLAQRKKSGDANSVNEAQDAVRGATTDVQKTKAALEEAERERSTRSDVRADAERKVGAELEKQRLTMAMQTRELSGQITAEDIRARITAQNEQARRREITETGSSTQTDALTEAQTRVALLAQLRQQFGDTMSALRSGEDAIKIDVDQGVISTVEGERRKASARQEALPVLQALIDKQRELVRTESEKGGIAQAQVAVNGLKAPLDEFQNTVKSSGKSAFSGFVTDIVSGSKTAGAAFRDMVGGFAKSMLDLIAKKMGEKLMNSLFDAVGGGAAGAAGGAGSGVIGGMAKAATNWIGSFFHVGGVVGGNTVRTSVMSPAIWSMAPRYHTGGIAGLAPNEVPAILNRGEEVLTAQDPRHVRNGGGASGSQFNISVSVSGAEGDQAGQVKQLTKMVESTVSAWAVNQSRPGGMLFKG